MKSRDSLYLDALSLAFMLCPALSPEESLLEQAIEDAFGRLKLGVEERMQFLHAAAKIARDTNV